MNSVIQINFRDETGRFRAGELVNPYRLIESVDSRSGVAIEVDYIGDDEIDVLVWEGEDMHSHRISTASIIGTKEVTV